MRSDSVGIKVSPVLRSRLLLFFFGREDMFIRARNQQELLSEDRGAFQDGSARTRSDAAAAHMREASGIMQVRQTRQIQIDEDACIRN